MQQVVSAATAARKPSPFPHVVTHFIIGSQAPELLSAELLALSTLTFVQVRFRSFRTGAHRFHGEDCAQKCRRQWHKAQAQESLQWHIPCDTQDWAPTCALPYPPHVLKSGLHVWSRQPAACATLIDKQVTSLGLM